MPANALARIEAMQGVRLLLECKRRIDDSAQGQRRRDVEEAFDRTRAAGIDERLARG